MNITFFEHGERPFSDLPAVDFRLTDLPMPQQADKNLWLGLHLRDCRTQSVGVGFYIGMAWLKEGEHSLTVLPKIKIDYLRMFLECFQSDDEDILDKLMQIYSINLEQPSIRFKNPPFELTPFLIIHYLQLLRRITRKGLKKDYILHEENLKGKVKGKIRFTQHFKTNVLQGRYADNYCRYQEYTVDCIENRILKKALVFVGRYLNAHALPASLELHNLFHTLMPHFNGVSDIDHVKSVRQYSINPFYREYARALKVAKLILSRFGYDLNSVAGEIDCQVPPFWIDMSLLYELYVLSRLRQTYGSSIVYHLSSRHDEIDFGKRDEQLIIDAKYIPKWSDTVNTGNIGQLARYGRSYKIRKQLLGEGDDHTCCNTLIIYPTKGGLTRFTSPELLKEPAVRSLEYLKMYKLGIELPIISFP